MKILTGFALLGVGIVVGTLALVTRDITHAISCMSVDTEYADVGATAALASLAGVPLTPAETKAWHDIIVKYEACHPERK